jgi:cardiolipin synthase
MQALSGLLRQLLTPLLLLTMLLGIGCGTATTPYQGEVSPSKLGQWPAATESSPATAIAARVADGHVTVTYQVEEDILHGQAVLGGGDGHRPPVRELERGTRQVSAAAEMEVVALRPQSAWEALLQRLQMEITPSTPGEGVVLDILQEEELLLYYDELGTLRSVPIVYKPREVKPVATVRLSQLLREVTERQAASLAQEAPRTRYLLYDTGDTSSTGYPFLLMDLATATVYFLRWPSDASQAAAVTVKGAGLQAPLFTLASQVSSLWTRPFSSVARLFTGVTTAAADTLRPKSLGALQDQPIPPLNDGPFMDSMAWERELDELVGTPPLPGQVDYLVDGDAFFNALIHAIYAAEHSISMRLYIFDNDDYALKIADMLKRRAETLDVRIVLDGLGTIGGAQAAPAYTPAYVRERPASIVEYLRHDSRIQVRTLPNPWLQGDHTKAIIFDGKRAFIGGMNIGREYRYEWHDLMIEATGPVAQAINEDFEQAWSRAGVLGEWGMLASPRRVPAVAPRAGDYPVRVLYTRTGRSEILEAQIAAIRRAQQRIYIQNAYFSSDAILYELAKARRRGVDVRVILPLESDFGVMSRSNAVAANAMLANGIRVFVYPRMSHVKGAVYDGWACYGSANFDRLSLRLNKELNLATSDPQAVQRFVEQVFEPDFAASVELTEPLPLKWMDYLMELIADHL